jgi:hypothetical protein
MKPAIRTLLFLAFGCFPSALQAQYTYFSQSTFTGGSYSRSVYFVCTIPREAIE